MNKLYPFTDAQILTDDIYVDYGGSLLDSTPLQRSAAYLIAEELLSYELGTPVAPATITGTYYYPQEGSVVQLDWMYLQNVTSIKFIDTKGTAYSTIEGTDNYKAAIRSHERSIVDILQIYGNCQSCAGYAAPYQYEIVYEAGLPTGTYASSKMLMALTTAAEIFVNEFIGYGNETPGGMVGVKKFSNQDYSEERYGTVDTVFGRSPKAMLINKLISGIKRKRFVGL